MHKSTRRTRRGLALFALIVFGIACWQTSNWSNSAVHAAAVRATRAALDEATARFKADPTRQTADQLQDARNRFAKAAAADPSYAASSATMAMAPSALLQLEIMQNMKSSLTPVQKKIGSRLMLAARRSQGKMPLGLESFRTSVELGKSGNPLVNITAASRIIGLKAIDHYHFVIRSAVGKTILAEVPFDKLEEVAALPGIISIREPMKRLTNGIDPSSASPASSGSLALSPGFSARAARATSKLSGALASLGARKPSRGMFVDNVSEGDKTHRADDARNAFLVNGTGVKVGVISDGVNSLAARQGTGDLGPVTVLPGQAGTGDEGTAMLEIVHDLAPGAQLFFATADPDQAQFAQNIRDLRTAGCDIIVDDIIYLDESPLHDGQQPGLNSTLGIIAQAVNDVTASGALYFSSAGNEGNKDDGTSGTWEGNFVANGTPPAIAGAGPVNNFGDGGQSILVTNASFDPPVLHWSDPLDTSSNDYDLYDMDNTLTTVFDASFDTQDGSGGDDQPFEFIPGGSLSNERLVVAQFSGVARFLSLRIFRGTFDPALATTGSTHGHSSCASAFSTAATPAAASFDGVTADGPFPGPFTSANVTESFTSDGPRQLFFKADGTLFGTGVLAGQGLIRAKPDLTAADGVMSTPPGFNPFYGTSASAPHAAAIAALVKSANLLLTPAQIRTALVSSAIDIEAPGADRDTGAGIVMAYEALLASGAPASTFLKLGTVSFTETGGDGDGFPEPCERLNFTVGLNNIGAAATNVSGTLSSTTPGVVINPNVSAYPDIPTNGSANNTTPFTVVLPCNLACGSVVNFTLTVTYTGGSSPQTFNFSYFLGAPGTPVTFSFTGPPVPIPDGLNTSGTLPGAPALANLIVSGTGPIFDINFRIDGTSCSTAAASTTVGIDHTFVSDLRISLTSPLGTNVQLINFIDDNANNFCQTLLDDESSGPSIQTAATSDAPFTGSFKPNSPLSAFDGQNANGTWVLSVQDFFSTDTGNIRAFSLIVTPTVCQTSACVLTCPANITTTGPAGGTTVNYAQPTSTGGCGVVTCAPASGSTFPVGTTTVTCSSQATTSCSFTVTVIPDCTITCPGNITQSNDPNQCGAVVNYPAPTTTGSCGTVTCSPAAGSFFPKGTTTVTCNTTSGPSCTFTVSINDTQPPSITCPANKSAKTAAVNDPCVVVSYTTTASDNCPGVTVVCSPPSGSCFPVGSSTVTCTATDTSGNTATCSFTVSVFNVCVQDDSNPSSVFLGNSISGAYKFCCGGTTYTGVATVTKRGSIITFQQTATDRRVQVTDDESVFKGTASLQAPPGTNKCTITDKDTRNNSCNCP